MSGIMKRMTMIFRSKANKALDRAEDPRETLDYSYQRQVELLTKVRRGVADVATSRNSAFMSHFMSSRNCTASQSSNSGWLGGSLRVPKSLSVLTMPVPKC